MKRTKLRKRLDEYTGKGYWNGLDPEYKAAWLKIGAYDV